MKKVLSIILAATLAVMLSACGITSGTGTIIDTAENVGTSAGTNASSNDSTVAETTAQAEPAVTDSDITAEETTDAFSLTTENGTVENSGNIYTITSAGTYTVSGLLNGQIVVDAGDDDEVVIELSGATITYGDDSPIKILSADSVDISAKKGT